MNISLSLFTFRLSLIAFCLGVFTKVLSLSVKFLDVLAKISPFFIKNLAKKIRKLYRPSDFLFLRESKLLQDFKFILK
ncbi:hypothetical protein DRF68_10450 [Candidatus Chryseobacterium massiliae]|uniref:Uncharacterized protein n=1 Tax=Candidatus Chryseobacterium massiliense TaxID=204089 RepID=A0A3D9B853_9FLAO|nr:hypothetical protein DRF68_10450 [Candidatus Chryseobacterium massiliae]